MANEKLRKEGDDYLCATCGSKLNGLSDVVVVAVNELGISVHCKKCQEVLGFIKA